MDATDATHVIKRSTDLNTNWNDVSYVVVSSVVTNGIASMVVRVALPSPHPEAEFFRLEVK